LEGKSIDEDWKPKSGKSRLNPHGTILENQGAS
jgi:hypothetical protein